MPANEVHLLPGLMDAYLISQRFVHSGKDYELMIHRSADPSSPLHPIDEWLIFSNAVEVRVLSNLNESLWASTLGRSADHFAFGPALLYPEPEQRDTERSRHWTSILKEDVSEFYFETNLQDITIFATSFVSSRIASIE